MSRSTKLFGIIILVILSVMVFASVPSASAMDYCPPGFDPYTCQLLGQASSAGSEALNYAQTYAVPAANARQQYLQNLYEQCVYWGNTYACQEYNYEMSRQLSHMDNLINQYNNMYGSDWSNSFGG